MIFDVWIRIFLTGTLLSIVSSRVVSFVKGVIFFTNNKYYETLVVGDGAATQYTAKVSYKWNFQPKRISRTDIACCTLNAKMKTHTSKIKALEIAHGMRLFGQRGAFALAAFFGFRSTLRKEILATDLLQLYFASIIHQSSTLKLRVSNCKFLNTMYCVFYYLAIRL